MERQHQEIIKKKEVQQVVDSVKLYNIFWNHWKCIGISWNSYKYLWLIYDIFLNITITSIYPVHLTIVLFFTKSFADLTRNLAANATCIASSLKHYCLRYELQNIRQLLRKVSELDRRASRHPDEVQYFNSVIKIAVNRISHLIFYLFQATMIVSFISVLVSKEKRQLFPGWFPFDWRAPEINYWIATIYQFVGAFIIIVTNTANDIYPPMTLCLVGGHVHLLKKRVSRIGYDEQSTLEENNAELKRCIQDHKTLIDVIHLLQSNLFYTQFFQFLSSGLNICATVVFMVLYLDDIYLGLYFAGYLTSMVLELFLWCYYGSLLLEELETLPHALLECNWTVQNRQFRRHLVTFIELTLKKIELKAGFFNMNLNAFFSTMKMVYSLYTILTETRK